MLVKECMSKNVVSIRESAFIQDALQLMKEHSIRHLPVFSDSGEFVGWITDSDVRGVLIASMLEEISVADVMVRKPLTIRPDDYVEDAARLMIEKKIGGLPVVDDSQVVGVITVVDVLKASMELLGITRFASRLDLIFPEDGKDVELAKVVSIVEDNGGKIQSLYSSQEGKYSLYLKQGDMSRISGALENAGLHVVCTEARKGGESLKS
ncbi:MAG: CBS domain-containing protein [Deltaproteobacteria bacterium]|nr:CBS domain-containing protein [Deltaproteobacteria bacterium]